MDQEDDFGALYKRLIDGHLAPDPARAEAALQALLSTLALRDPPDAPPP